MSDERSPNPDPLDDDLRRVVAAVDPVPGPVLDAARVAFTWRTVDEELAALVADSAATLGLTAGVRSAPGGPRLLTFEAPSLAIEVEVDEEGGRRLLGQLVPPQPGEVEVLTPDGAVVAVIADPLGRFLAEDVPAGPLRLVVTGPGGLRVATSWTTL